jgi:hypothetical protein
MLTYSIIGKVSFILCLFTSNSVCQNYLLKQLFLCFAVKIGYQTACLILSTQCTVTKISIGFKFVLLETEEI